MAVEGGGWRLVEIAPNDLVIDRALNPRLEIDKETIEHYMEVYDDLPPIEAFDTERGRVLVDGWHRHGAGKALGRPKLPVRVKDGTYREALEYAALANLRHGKALTARERSRAAETVLRLHPDWSDAKLARTTGFSQPGIGKMRLRLGIPNPITVIPPGPLHRTVLEGDCLERIAEIEDGSVDLLFVDPPYGILAAQGQEWDAFPDRRALMRFTRAWIGAVLPKLKRTGRLFVCFSQWHVHWLRPMLDYFAGPSRFDLLYSNTLIWHYKNVLSAPADRQELKLLHEPILHYRARDARPLDFSVYGEEQGDVWEIATPQSNFTEGKEHPAQKPLELLRRIICLGCPADGLVLDPMAGSGTTGVAAYQLGRAFRLIERQPEYVTIARRRLDEVRAAPATELLDAAGD